VSEAGVGPPPIARFRARDALRVPGLLSLCRLPLAAVFPFSYRDARLAIALLVAAAATDLLDGWYARRFHQETPMGAALDGVMDKAFGFSVLATLVASGALSWVEAVVLSAREIGEGVLIPVSLALRPRPAITERSANRLGKAATAMQFATAVAVVVGAGAVPRMLCVVATGVCGAAAAVVYAVREFGPARRS
jgi:cardiolipin synthase (CMP-forming)